MNFFSLATRCYRKRKIINFHKIYYEYLFLKNCIEAIYKINLDVGGTNLKEKHY